MRRPALRALAERLGIAGDYLAQTGERREVSDATRIALLRSLGFDGATEPRAREALSALAAAQRARALEPVAVVRADSAASARLRVRAPGSGLLAWRLGLVDEAGMRREARGRTRPRGGWLELALPLRLAAGYHDVELELAGRLLRQRRIAAPAGCTPVRAKLGGRSALGLWAQLALLRDARERGCGDLGTLRELIRRSAAAGIDFIGLEPLHARLPPSSSPYSPLSRLFRDPLYLDVEAVPELRGCAALRSKLDGTPSRRSRVREAEHVDRATAWERARAILEPLHAEFSRRQREHPTPRGREYASFLSRGGEVLGDFATYCALAEQLGSHDHRKWPARFRERSGVAVASFRRDRAALVDFHAWVQFELERQLGAAARAARAAGMRIGLYADLAVGSAPGGFDVWGFPGLFARAAHIGCPPDFYSSTGQDWGLPPLDPQRLRESGFAYFAALLRAGFAHAGALRIDHAMGLRRLFWIPEGRPASEGAYVAYPERELRAILALESRRARALAIGEDLGTVPAGFPESLAREGILSTRIVFFEHRGARYRPASGYSPRALVSVDNHDMPPLAGWVEARDVELRRAAGALSRRAARTERAGRARAVEGLRRRLRAERLLDARSAGDVDALGVALAGFAARTPAPLVALGLDDLAGEREPINVPGVPESGYRSWSRRARVNLRDTFARPAARAALELARRERRRRRSS